MFALLIAAGLLGAPALELELASGFAHSLEEATVSSASYQAAVFTGQARAALEFADRVSLGASLGAILGGQAPNLVACCGDVHSSPAFTATAAIASLRLRSQTAVQLWGQAGAGVGHLISLQQNDNFEHPPLRGRGGVVLQLAGGARTFVARQVAIGFELQWLRWSNVEQGPGAFCDGSGCPHPQATTALLLLLSLTWSPTR